MRIKKIIALVVMIVHLLTLTPANAEMTDDLKAKDALRENGVVDPIIFAGDEIVTRNDCVALVLKAIGVPEDVFLESFGMSGGPIYSELDNYDIDEYYQKCKFTVGSDYVTLGFMYAKIVQGEQMETERRIYFNFLRAVTVKEALAYMVRCLNTPTGLDVSDPEVTLKRAEELDLLLKTDSFYSKSDEPISPNDLFILLHRFLYQNRGLYYRGIGFGDFTRDESGSMKYIQYLDYFHRIREEMSVLERMDFLEKLEDVK